MQTLKRKVLKKVLFKYLLSMLKKIRRPGKDPGARVACS